MKLHKLAFILVITGIIITSQAEAAGNKFRNRSKLKPKDYAAEGNVFDHSKLTMNYANNRQRVLSQNLANANVPKYRVRDIDFKDYKKLVKNSIGSVGMSVTSSRHIQPKDTSRLFRAKFDLDAKDIAPNGNNVNLADQTAKLAENSEDHRLASLVYKKFIGMNRIALGVR